MMSLPLLLLLAVGLQAVRCQESMTRQQLTEEVGKLDQRLDLVEDKLGLTNDREKLGEKLAAAVETMGHALGDRLTEAVQSMGQVLSGSLTEAVDKMKETLVEKLTDSTGKLREGPTQPSSCMDVREYGRNSSIHTLTVNGRQIRVFCDQDTAGGGWTVIQRRRDGREDFYRDWDEYRYGFGDLNSEFWLGLDNIHLLTTSRTHTLRVDLEDFDGNTAYAEFSYFIISGPDTNYRLHVRRYRGDAGDSLSGHNNQAFSTKDRDHDTYDGECARAYHGAWWYTACHASNLNGPYLPSAQETADSISWNAWRSKYIALRRVEMKIRPDV